MQCNDMQKMKRELSSMFVLEYFAYFLKYDDRPIIRIWKMRYIKPIPRPFGQTVLKTERARTGWLLIASSHIGAESQFGLNLNEVSQFSVLYCCIRNKLTFSSNPLNVFTNTIHYLLSHYHELNFSTNPNFTNVFTNTIIRNIVLLRIQFLTNTKSIFVLTNKTIYDSLLDYFSNP